MTNASLSLYLSVIMSSRRGARRPRSSFVFFFFNDTATTEIYTLSLHDALPIYRARERIPVRPRLNRRRCSSRRKRQPCYTTNWNPRRAPRRMPSLGRTRVGQTTRSEEHTSELQSPDHLVCRLLLEKKKKQQFDA